MFCKLMHFHQNVGIVCISFALRKVPKPKLTLNQPALFYVVIDLYALILFYFI